MATTPRLEEWMRLSKERLSNTSIMREYIETLYIRPQSFSTPQNLGPDVSIERVDAADWPLYRISTSPGRPAVLYCHGGNFVNEIVSQHYKFVVQIARDTGLDVLVAVYPLVPRDTATFELVVEDLCVIVTQSKQRIVSIAGDSVGGTLVMLTMQISISTQCASGIKSLILISPLLDCTLSYPQAKAPEAEDPWLGIDGLRLAAEMFSGRLNLSKPEASPLFGDIEGLPATLLLSGTRDLLCADARRLSARFRNRNKSENTEECIAGSVEFEGFKYVEAEGMVHVWPLTATSEGAQAREVIMEFLRTHQ